MKAAVTSNMKSNVKSMKKNVKAAMKSNVKWNVKSNKSNVKDAVKSNVKSCEISGEIKCGIECEIK